MASWLVSSIPDGAVRVQALAGDTVLSFWARDLTLTVPLSIHVCVKMDTGELNVGREG